MKQTAIFPGRYVQSEGAVEGLAEELIRLGKSALIVAGGTAMDPTHVVGPTVATATALEQARAAR